MFTRPALAIIDDDNDILNSLDSLMRACGYTAHLFDSAEKLLASDVLTTLDCLISDIQMPGMNGVQMYRALQERGYSIPVVFITASTERAPRLQAATLDACRYLAKPFDSEELVACVEALLGAAK